MLCSAFSTAKYKDDNLDLFFSIPLECTRSNVTTVKFGEFLLFWFAETE